MYTDTLPRIHESKCNFREQIDRYLRITVGGKQIGINYSISHIQSWPLVLEVGFSAMLQVLQRNIRKQQQNR